MKLHLLKPTAAATLGLLLAAPAAYFVLIALLKYAFGWPALFNAAEPFLNSLGAKEPLGWNVNLLFVGGPLLCFLLNLSTLVQWNRNGGNFELQFCLLHRTLNWTALLGSGIVLGILFLYAFAENCSC